MSADFQISFPAFSMRRVLKEACASWNLRHPDNHADPDESEWPLLYNAVHAKTETPLLFCALRTLQHLAAPCS
jgi:hypothetical protein